MIYYWAFNLSFSPPSVVLEAFKVVMSVLQPVCKQTQFRKKCTITPLHANKRILWSIYLYFFRCYYVTSRCLPLKTTAKAPCPIRSFLLNSNFPTVSISDLIPNIAVGLFMWNKAGPQISSFCVPLLLCLDEAAGKLNPTSACHGQPFHTNTLLFHDILDVKRRSTPFKYDCSTCRQKRLSYLFVINKIVTLKNTTLKRKRWVCLCTSDVVSSANILAFGITSSPLVHDCT